MSKISATDVSKCMPIIFKEPDKQPVIINTLRRNVLDVAEELIGGVAYSFDQNNFTILYSRNSKFNNSKQENILELCGNIVICKRCGENIYTLSECEALKILRFFKKEY